MQMFTSGTDLSKPIIPGYGSLRPGRPWFCCVFWLLISLFPSLVLAESLIEPRIVSNTGPVPVGETVHYDALATGSQGIEYQWFISDGAESEFDTGGSFTHKFSYPGRYTVTVTVRDAEGLIRKARYIQRVYDTPSDKASAASSGMFYDRDASRLWVTNPDNDTVTVIDTMQNKKLAEIVVGKSPVSIAKTRVGEVWVANKASATISVINPETLAVMSSVELPRGSQPHGMVSTNLDAAVYVAMEGTGQLWKLDSEDKSLQNSISLAAGIRHLSLDPGRDRLYVSRFITPPLRGESGPAIDVKQNAAEIICISSKNMQREPGIMLPISRASDTETIGGGVPNYLGPLVVSPDGKNAWLPSKQDNILRGETRNAKALNFQNTVRAIVSRIDLQQGNGVYQHAIDLDNAGLASYATFDRYGTILAISLETSREVAILDPTSNSELFRVDTGYAPGSIVLSADGETLYVHNYLDRTVTVHSLSARIHDQDAQVPVLARIDLVESEQLSASVLKGKKLFHDARDNRLARDNYLSCASCHNEGKHDGRVWDFSQFGQGLRNTISLLGKGGVQHGRLHWTGNFDEVQDFEFQIRNLAGGTGLMDDRDYRLTKSPLGKPKAGRSEDLDALADYVSSLTVFPLNPHGKVDDNKLAVKGRALFKDKACDSCHSGDDYTDSSLQSLGKESPFDTPTLLDLWETAPYLHDGSAQSIKEAIKYHSQEPLSELELSGLAAYLMRLSGSTFD